jgi:hypothetical protein
VRVHVGGSIQFGINLDGFETESDRTVRWSADGSCLSIDALTGFASASCLGRVTVTVTVASASSQEFSTATHVLVTRATAMILQLDAHPHVTNVAASMPFEAESGGNAKESYAFPITFLISDNKRNEHAGEGDSNDGNALVSTENVDHRLLVTCSLPITEQLAWASVHYHSVKVYTNSSENHYSYQHFCVVTPRAPVRAARERRERFHMEQLASSSFVGEKNSSDSNSVETESPGTTSDEVRSSDGPDGQELMLLDGPSFDALTLNVRASDVNGNHALNARFDDAIKYLPAFTVWPSSPSGAEVSPAYSAAGLGEDGTNCLRIDELNFDLSRVVKSRNLQRHADSNTQKYKGMDERRRSGQGSGFLVTLRGLPAAKANEVKVSQEQSNALAVARIDSEILALVPHSRWATFSVMVSDNYRTKPFTSELSFHHASSGQRGSLCISHIEDSRSYKWYCSVNGSVARLRYCRECPASSTGEKGDQGGSTGGAGNSRHSSQVLPRTVHCCNPTAGAACDVAERVADVECESRNIPRPSTACTSNGGKDGMGKAVEDLRDDVAEGVEQFLQDPLSFFLTQLLVLSIEQPLVVVAATLFSLLLGYIFNVPGYFGFGDRSDLYVNNGGEEDDDDYDQRDGYENDAPDTPAERARFLYEGMRRQVQNIVHPTRDRLQNSQRRGEGAQMMPRSPWRDRSMR